MLTADSLLEAARARLILAGRPMPKGGARSLRGAFGGAIRFVAACDKLELDPAEMLATAQAIHDSKARNSQAAAGGAK